jgi:hypothetical protein
MKAICLNCTLKRSPGERILAADILVVATPTWLGQPSSNNPARPSPGAAGISDPARYRADTKEASIAVATEKQREAAKRNVRKAQAGAEKKQTLKNLPAKTRSALGKEAAAVRRGDEPTRRELEAQARELDIEGRSKIGKAELKRAVARAKGS